MDRFRGTITAIVTPFKDGEVDSLSLKKLVKFQLDQGIDGLVVSGTTGESPTLTASDKSNILEMVRSEVSGQVPVIMGTGSNCTRTTIEASQEAQKAKADALLVVVPYYNKPTQEGLRQHFSKVAESVDLPIILYNVPGRTVASLEVETIKELSEVDNIIGIKDATGDIEIAKKILELCGSQFTLLSGDDFTYLDFCEAGGHGVISVLTNILPKQAKLWALEVKSKAREVKPEFSNYLDLLKALYCEPNPIPIKMALHWMDLIASPELRLPLVGLSKGGQDQLRFAMQKVGLL